MPPAASAAGLVHPRGGEDRLVFGQPVLRLVVGHPRVEVEHGQISARSSRHAHERVGVVAPPSTDGRLVLACILKPVAGQRRLGLLDTPGGVLLITPSAWEYGVTLGEFEYLFNGYDCCEFGLCHG